jgi:hypothetical protein
MVSAALNIHSKRYLFDDTEQLCFDEWRASLNPRQKQSQKRTRAQEEQLKVGEPVRKERKVTSASQGAQAQLVDYSGFSEVTPEVERDSLVKRSDWASTKRDLTVQVTTSRRGNEVRDVVKHSPTPLPQREARPPRVRSPKVSQVTELPELYEYLSGAPGYTIYVSGEQMGDTKPKLCLQPWTEPMCYEPNPTEEGRVFSERGFVGVEKPGSFDTSKLVSTIGEQDMPPAGYVQPEDRRVITTSLPVPEKGLEVSFALLQELNSLKWDIGAVTHHMDGELKRQSVGEYQARERYLNAKLAASQAQVRKLQEEKEELEMNSAKDLVDLEALAGALGVCRAELSEAKTQRPPPLVTSPPGEVLATQDYRVLVLEGQNQLLKQTLELVTSNESTLKEQVIELKEEKAELKADVKAEKELHRASQVEWRAREARWHDGRSSLSSSGSGPPATGVHPEES